MNPLTDSVQIWPYHIDKRPWPAENFECNLLFLLVGLHRVATKG